MSSNTIRFTCTQLAKANKQGILKPDAAGYYTQVVGGLNVLNSAGEYYTLRGAEQLFKESSAFMRRVQRGALRGENGHPRQDGMTDNQYAQRIITIVEGNVCAHHKEIWLDMQNYRDADGKPIVAIMSKVKPSGPYAKMLQDQYDNPNENVCFSIRAFTEDYWAGGRRNRELRTIVTFDYVNEPGISIAEKYKSPGLESLQERVFTRSQIERAMDTRETLIQVGMESVSMSKDELFTSFGWNKPTAPAYTRW